MNILPLGDMHLYPLCEVEYPKNRHSCDLNCNLFLFYDLRNGKHAHPKFFQKIVIRLFLKKSGVENFKI